MRLNENYVMVKMPTPKRATLPDGRSFPAKYKRVSRDSQPPNVTIGRRYKQRVAPKNRHRQRDRGFLDFVKNVANKLAVKALRRAALKRAPTLLDNTSQKTKKQDNKKYISI